MGADYTSMDEAIQMSRDRIGGYYLGLHNWPKAQGAYVLVTPALEDIFLTMANPTI